MTVVLPVTPVSGTALHSSKIRTCSRRTLDNSDPGVISVGEQRPNSLMLGAVERTSRDYGRDGVGRREGLGPSEVIRRLEDVLQEGVRKEVDLALQCLQHCRLPCLISQRRSIPTSGLDRGDDPAVEIDLSLELGLTPLNLLDVGVSDECESGGGVVDCDPLLPLVDAGEQA